MKDVKGTNNISFGHGGYRIEKRINGKSVYCGFYSSLIVALMVRDWFDAYEWPEESINSFSNPEKYINLLKGKYVIYKYLDGYNRYFGSYETLEEARDVKVALIGAGWPCKPYKKVWHDLPKYVSYVNEDTVELRYKNHYYGRFHSISEAVDVRDALSAAGWPKHKINRVCKQCLPKYIYYISNGFAVQKHIHGRMVHFGFYHTLREALRERDKLIDCDWNFDIMESLDETINNSIIWLGRLMY